MDWVTEKEWKPGGGGLDLPGLPIDTMEGSDSGTDSGDSDV